MSPDDSTRAEAASLLLRQYSAFSDARGRSSAFWEKVVKRSPFQTMAVQQLYGMLRAGGGVASQRMQERVNERLLGIGQSLLSECGMNIGRRAESRAANKQKQPLAKVWRAMIDKGLAQNLFRYDQIDYTSQSASSGQRAQLPRALFNVKARDAPTWVKKIIGTRPMTEWHSAGPSHMNEVFADMALLDVARRHNSWSEVSKKAQFACLCSGRGLVVQAPMSTDWYLVLGVMCNKVVLGWKATVMGNNGVHDIVRPTLDGHAELLVILDPDAWQAMQFKWTSPVGAVLRGLASSRDSRERPGLIARVVEQSTSLLHLSAKNCFWHLSWSALGWFCGQLGVKSPSGDPILKRLEKLVKKVIPDLSEASLLEILSLRTIPANHWDHYLMQDAAEDLVDEQDRKAFHSHVDTVKATAKELDTVKTDYMARARASRAPKPSGGASSSSSEVKVYRSSSGHRIQGDFPTGQVLVEFARLMAPPPIRIFEVDVNGRWQAYYPNVGSASRSFSLWGHTEALRQILVCPWEHILLRDGLPTSACPIKGLFPAALA